MTNHVHLLVAPETETGIAKRLQAIRQRYMQYINHSYRRTGNVWEGRYKSSVIRTEIYLLTFYPFVNIAGYAVWHRPAILVAVVRYRLLF